MPHLACYSALLKSVHKYGAVFMARKTFGWGLIAVMPFYLMEDAAPVEALTVATVKPWYMRGEHHHTEVTAR